MHNRRFYRLGLLEMALVSLRTYVTKGEFSTSLRFTPTQAATLLEAARMGLARIYENPEILDRIDLPLP